MIESSEIIPEPTRTNEDDKAGAEAKAEVGTEASRKEEEEEYFLDDEEESINLLMLSSKSATS